METTAGRRNATKKYVLIWFTENLNPEIRKYCANKLRTITVLNDDVRKNVLWIAKKRFESFSGAFAWPDTPHRSQDVTAANA
jgi:hypothetical protein